MKKILVLCTGNSCRSQMAHGYLKHLVGSNAEVYSAGIETHGVNKMAIWAMKEDGVDISNHTSNHIDQYKDIQFDFVITVCDNAKEKCPYFPSSAKLYHRNFPDPSKITGAKDEIENEFRKVRNMIKEYCITFTKENLNDND